MPERANHWWPNMTEPYVCKLTKSSLIPHSSLTRIANSLMLGGLCIVPSDTCYVLASIPFIRHVCRDINLILERGNQPISVTFGTQRFAERFVEFSHPSLQLLEDLTPGAITIVSPLKLNLPDELANMLNGALNNPKREIAIRFPDSPSEVQLSNELERPLTTTAIYYPDKRPVKDFEDAVTIVLRGVARCEIEREIAGVQRHRRTFDSDLSTVLEAAMAYDARGVHYTIFREGEVSEKKVRNSLQAVNRRTFRRTDEW
jgi:tRNA A37 threonylcarbamoyladenosine synthetase subunit TsaC/SUA5/YrdC